MSRAYTPYRDIPECLRNLTPFNGNSMSGFRYDVEWSDIAYVVKSYDTIIAFVDDDNNTHISDEYYSHTTSRHQNLCRAYLNKRI